MEFEKLYNSCNELPEETRHSILKVIDLKASNDMRELIEQLKNLERSQELRMVGFEKNITQLEKNQGFRLVGFEKNIAHLEKNINHLEKNQHSQIENLKWFIGIGIAAIALLVAYIGIFK